MKNLHFSRRHFVFSSLKSAGGLLVAGSYGVSLPSIISSQTGADKEIFDFEGGEVCTLTCSQTLGPCYAPNPLVRRDITSGKLGMPVNLVFRVLDTNCQPIQNALVDIWHADTNGVYSALAGFCANGDATAPSQNFLRGIQATDANGYSYFDTIYPGWYPSRTTHIHVTIRIGSTNIVTTQFYFFDRLNSYVFHTHPRYSHRPVAGTTNTTDNILGGSIPRMMPYIFSTRLASTKSLRAWKTIVINTTPTTCNA